MACWLEDIATGILSATLVWAHSDWGMGAKIAKLVLIETLTLKLRGGRCPPQNSPLRLT